MVQYSFDVLGNNDPICYWYGGESSLSTACGNMFGGCFIYGITGSNLRLRYSYVKSKLVEETLSYDSIRGGLRQNRAAIIITFFGIFAALKSVYLSYVIYVVVLGIFMIPLKMEKRKRSLKTTVDSSPAVS